MVGIITQARTTSTRLPAKVLLEAGGKTMLQHHIDRIRQSGYSPYIATTTNATDDAIVAFAEEEGIPFHRGSEQDVLGRFYECATKFGLKKIVRVTSDCPLIDGKLLGQAIAQYLSYADDSVYLSNALERTFPRGMDFEIFSYDLLEKAFFAAQKPQEREHVTPWLYHQNPTVIIHHFKQKEDHSAYRITLDTPDDFNLIRLLIEQEKAHTLNVAQIVSLLEKHPEWVAINAHIEQKKW